MRVLVALKPSSLVCLLLTTLALGRRHGDAHAAAARGMPGRQVRVARGYFTFIQPSDVTISRSSTASQCKISVDLADLTTLQVGTVHPDVRLTIPSSSSGCLEC